MIMLWRKNYLSIILCFMLCLLCISVVSKAWAQSADPAYYSVLEKGKAVVNAANPNAGVVYDLIDHELKQLYTIDLYRDGDLSVPFGYTSDDALTVGISYNVFKMADYTKMPILDLVQFTPYAGIGLCDITNILEKPSSLSKDNFGAYLGAKIIDWKFGPQKGT